MDIQFVLERAFAAPVDRPGWEILLLTQLSDAPGDDPVALAFSNVGATSNGPNRPRGVELE